MKLVRCEWAPSLVVEWLCGELEDRGIPGPTYAHTLLSLLHHHYCPHPPPTCPTPAAPALAVASAGRRYHHPLSRRHLDDFDLRDLDLDDLLGYTAHPDADLPDPASFTPQQRGWSRRARKRHKVRQKHRILTSEQLQKVAALQCLMSASDERYDLESLVEELCLRLKTAAENERLNTSNSLQSCINKKPVALKAVGRASCNETDDYASSSTPEEQAEKYYAAFPPLSGSSRSKCDHEEAWKFGNTLCSCVLEGQKSSRVGKSETFETSKMPRNHRKKVREKGKKEAGAKYEAMAIPGQGEPPYHCISYAWNNPGKHKEAKLCENYDTDSASEPERNVERRRKKFVGPLLDEDIGEGYIGDASSRESSEDRDKGDQDGTEKAKEEKSEKGSSHNGDKGRVCQEEWECMGYLLLGAIDNEEKNRAAGGGNRLFERGSTSDGTSGSSSDVETQENECVKQLERKISNTAPQVWGQAGEFLGHGRGEHVWDPPAVQEMALYTTIWGFNTPKQQQNTVDSATFHQNSLNKLVQEPSTPIISDGWQHNSWHTVNCGTEEDPLLSMTNQSPLTIMKESSFEVLENHKQINSLDKSIWSDCNANDISGNDSTIPTCLEDAEKHYGDEEQIHAREDLEKKLLESFMQMSLENLWDCNKDPDSLCNDFAISNNNLEGISETESFDGAQDTHTDSDQEKMRALVEDVCKSYESHESSLNSSVSKPVLAGPAGPHADLHHTEHSGFSMVVPRGKSAESNSPLEQRPESLVLEVEDGGFSQCGLGRDRVGRASIGRSGDTLPTTQEEENLLTSPRTHFRPIRQDSSGSTADDNYEDGTMFLVNSERPDLPFQRTGSGALFLESDLLEGSPKKYMVYKEPVPKIIHPEDQQEQKAAARKNYPVMALVPKFKVVNNEKFCQTEEEGLPFEKKLFTKHREKAKTYTERYLRKSEEKEPDVFEFQQQDFPDSSNLANIWKSGLESSDPRGLDNIWKVKDMQGNESVWSGLRNIHKDRGVAGNAWLEKDEDGATGWSSEGNFEPPYEACFDHTSGAVIIPSSLASLWQHGSPSVSPVISSSVHSLQDVWASFASIDDTTPGKARRYVITNPTTHIPGKRPDNGHTVSSLIETDPWRHRDGENSETGSRKSQIWFESTQSKRPNHQHTDDHNKVLTFDVSTGAPVACTRLRLEVDEEADELLGAVHAQTAEPQSQLVGHRLSSPRPLHERLRKHTSGKPTAQFYQFPIVVGGTDSRLQGKAEAGGFIERENLDDLAPDWELNDGFEWGPQASAPLQDEDYNEGVCEDDDGEGGSGEILVWESEGTTYTLPVEYLEDSLYDQIFGASEPGSRRLGGSLPDLPTGHPSSSAVYFSRELEEQWRRSGIPYKVQFPRKPRAGRWVPPSRRPCTFFMEGSCRRNDCRFSHDLASITCRFWEEGSCLKGITCPFLHGYPLRRRRNKSEGAAYSEGGEVVRHNSPFEIDSEMDFPALGSSCDSKSGSVDDRSSLNVGSSNSHPTAAKKKKRKFITITKNVFGEMKCGDAEKALHRITRRERRRQHSEMAAAAANLHTTTISTTTSNSTDPPLPPLQAQRPIRKAKRHRILALGHDDGTVSDY